MLLNPNESGATKVARVPDQALGWMSLLMPLHRVRAAGAGHAAGWNGWVAEWMALWGAIAGNSFWSNLWMGLFARLAKHDTMGATLRAQVVQ